MKEKRFAPDAIIYFEGSKPDRAYIVKEGQVVLRYYDFLKGREEKEVLGPGDIFGFRSLLGGYPRDEEAQTVESTVLFEFTLEEFREFLLKNPDVMMRLLKSFSHVLREVAQAGKKLLGEERSLEEAAEGLFSLANFFYKEGRYKHAAYAFKRYIQDYPDAPRVEEAREMLDKVSRYIEAGITRASREEDEGESPLTLYFKAQKLLSEEKYIEASQIYEKIIKTEKPGSAPHRDSLLALARIYLKTGSPEAQKYLEEFIREYEPRKDRDVPVAYMLLAQIHEKNDPQKAMEIYAKITSMPGVPDDLRERARKRLEELKSGPGQ